VLEVDLPRPRRRLDLVSDARYVAAREAVLRFLYERHRYVEAA
jgi:nitrate/nitrite transport system ATP-binding protein